MALDFIEDVGRLPWSRGFLDNLFGELAPLGLDLGAGRVHFQSSFLHHSHGLFAFKPSASPDLFPGGIGGLAESSLRGGRELSTSFRITAAPTIGTQLRSSMCEAGP